MTTANVRLLVFPVDDLTLRRDVEEAMRLVAADASDDEARTAVEQRLRRWYRSVSIHERDRLGGYPDDPARVWYVYRDGRIRKRSARRERLYQALSAARVTCASSESLISRSRAAARVGRYTVEGHPTTSPPPGGGRPRGPANS